MAILRITSSVRLESMRTSDPLFFQDSSYPDCPHCQHSHKPVIISETQGSVSLCPRLGKRTTEPRSSQMASQRRIEAQFDASYERYMDPGFRYGITMAQANGGLAMRLASADVLPFDPIAFAGTMARSIDSVNNKIEELRSEAEEHNRRLADGIFEMTADPNLPFVKPSKLSDVPAFDLTSLTQASERLQEAAKNYHEQIQQALDNQRLDADTSSKLNSIVMRLEPSLLRSEGLPDRPWYRHQIWAPGVNTGYSGLAFPAVHEAIVLRDWKVAQDQVKVIAASLDQFTSTLKNATSVLSNKN